LNVALPFRRRSLPDSPSAQISIRNKRTSKFVVVLELWGSEYALGRGRWRAWANLELGVEDSHLVLYARPSWWIDAFLIEVTPCRVIRNRGSAHG
jgi:hypothetical protein